MTRLSPLALAFAVVSGCHGGAGTGTNVMHNVGSCSNLGPAGTWENVTPTELDFANWCVPGSMGCSGAGKTSTYGAHFFALDPTTSGTILLGTDQLGLWKSTDCGATWKKLNTGKNGAMLDGGRQWTIAIDPTDSRVIYTCAGYGPNGVFKSVNGGVDWEQLFADAFAETLPYKGFIEKITIDPTNHTHLVVSFHAPCMIAPSGGGCLAESMDAGATWKIIDSPQQWSEGDGQTMIDEKTWFFGNGSGIWRTSDGGGSWAQVFDDGSGSVFTAKDGTFYAAGRFNTLHSSDGVTWVELDNSHGGASVNGSSPIASDGVNLYSAQGAYGGEEPMGGWYWAAPLSAPTSWKNVFNPVTTDFGGSNLAYDADHHVLYSSNLTSGFWRVLVP